MIFWIALAVGTLAVGWVFGPGQSDTKDAETWELHVPRDAIAREIGVDLK